MLIFLRKFLWKQQLGAAASYRFHNRLRVLSGSFSGRAAERLHWQAKWCFKLCYKFFLKPSFFFFRLFSEHILRGLMHYKLPYRAFDVLVFELWTLSFLHDCKPWLITLWPWIQIWGKYWLLHPTFRENKKKWMSTFRKSLKYLPQGWKHFFFNRSLNKISIHGVIQRFLRHFQWREILCNS